MEVVVKFGFRPVNYQFKNQTSYQKAVALVEAQHVLNVEEKTYNGETEVHAVVIRQTSVTLPPYTVCLSIDENRKVIGGTCNCLAGIGGQCKHIGALVIYLNSENSDTKTSAECQWQKPAGAGKRKYSKGKIIAELYPPKKARNGKNDKPADPFGDLSHQIRNVSNCPLKLMVRAEIHAICQDIAGKILHDALSQCQDDSSVEGSEHPSLVQSEEFVIPDHIKTIFFGQDDSNLLSQVQDVEINFKGKCCKEIYSNLIMCNGADMCCKTLTDKQQWKNVRQFRITASRCYEIYTYSKGDWSTKSQRYFWPRNFSSKYVSHGIAYEGEARKIYTEFFNHQVIETGLIVFEKEPWLAASPDGVIIDNNGLPIKLLEIKCPYKGKDMSATDVLPTCNFIKVEDGVYVLKRKHAYYAQVQLGMALLNVSKCDFIVYCPFDRSFVHIPVNIDFNFCIDLILRLKYNYFQNMIHYICEQNK